VLEGFLVGIIDASLLRKAMQSCSGVDNAWSWRILPVAPTPAFWCSPPLSARSGRTATGRGRVKT
jgi:hypothetical protein